MRPGFVMLAHERLDRAAEVVRCLARQGAPVIVHVDGRASAAARGEMVDGFSDFTQVSVESQFRCDWGTWSLVRATLHGVRLLLEQHPEVTHVYLLSGACLPLRSVRQLSEHLARHPGTDFIESVSVADVPWIQGGLGAERFEYSFPFAWKRSRRAFDRWVRLQRRLGRKRRLPFGIVPHLGSQWWCLTRETLEAILSDPERRAFDRFFARSWIPDESYFQTLARRHSKRIVSRALTHSRFDWKGRPQLLYDDHLERLEKTDAFFARKVWSGADRLYARFLTGAPTTAASCAEGPDPWGVARRTEVTGRAGLLNAGRFPWWGFGGPRSVRPYIVLEGFDDLFEGFDAWLSARRGDLTLHGRLFAPEGAEFSDRADVWDGGCAAHPVLRDYNPAGFIANLVRARPEETQAFFLAASDSADAWPDVLSDRNASVFAIRGAFFRRLAETSGAGVERLAARLQAREELAMSAAASPDCRADVSEWSLADAVADPAKPLRAVLGALGAQVSTVMEMPRLKPLDRLPGFLIELANAGVTPRVVGDIRDWEPRGRVETSIRDHG